MSRDNPNVRALYRGYRKSARKRGLAFDLSLEWFYDITQQECYLCGKPPANVYVHHAKSASYTKAPFVYNGIDRVDNSLPYVSGNLMACCGDCNMAKKKMSIEQFLDFIVRVHDYNFGGNDNA